MEDRSHDMMMRASKRKRRKTSSSILRCGTVLDFHYKAFLMAFSGCAAYSSNYSRVPTTTVVAKYCRVALTRGRAYS
jgi:hypothetical protein